MVTRTVMRMKLTPKAVAASAMVTTFLVSVSSAGLVLAGYFAWGVVLLFFATQGQVAIALYFTQRVAHRDRRALRELRALSVQTIEAVEIVERRNEELHALTRKRLRMARESNTALADGLKKEQRSALAEMRRRDEHLHSITRKRIREKTDTLVQRLEGMNDRVDERLGAAELDTRQFLQDELDRRADKPVDLTNTQMELRLLLFDLLWTPESSENPEIATKRENYSSLLNRKHENT